MEQTRRQTLLQGFGAISGAAKQLPGPLGGLAAMLLPSASSARDVKVPYGAAVNPWALPDNAAYRQALASHCDLVVSETAMKWDTLRPTRAQYDFKAADEFVDFAVSNGLAMRGHTLVWYAALPPWVAEISDRADAEREYIGTIERVLDRYGDRIHSWDVVNEPIAVGPGRGLREAVWRTHMGDDYISIAFHTARRLAPHAELVLNEYGIETADSDARNKRADFLDLIRKLVDQNVPVDAIGLQAHLDGDRPIDRDGLHVFLREIDKLGLRVLVTELDVNDKMLPAPTDLIDALVAARAFEFLEVVFGTVRPTSVLTWGISDRYTWIPIWYARTDGLRNRCLPLDEDMRPKPFMSVIRHFCGNPGE